RPARPAIICLRVNVMRYQFASQKMRDFLTCWPLPRAGFHFNSPRIRDMMSRQAPYAFIAENLSVMLWFGQSLSEEFHATHTLEQPSAFPAPRQLARATSSQ